VSFFYLQRAILLGGSALSPWAMVDNPSPFFYMLAEQLHCPISKEEKDKRPELIGTDVILRCMQDHSAENITKAAKEINVPTFLSAFAPVVDGQMVPNKPKLSFSSQFGSLFRDIDLLVGTVSNPAHHLLADKDLATGVELPKRNQIYRYISPLPL
jgi:neuroligin